MDGLRGAAVLTVLLYDTGVGGRWFSWTGAGVDVLLVLTGFLTTLPLIRRATATGTTGVLGFLTRRAKRMIPALLVSVAATFAACWALGPPGVVRDLARQAASALPGHGEWADWLRGAPWARSRRRTHRSLPCGWVTSPRVPSLCGPSCWRASASWPDADSPR